MKSISSYIEERARSLAEDTKPHLRVQVAYQLQVYPPRHILNGLQGNLVNIHVLNCGTILTLVHLDTKSPLISALAHQATHLHLFRPEDLIPL